jgi:hypothetical protein
MSSSFIARIYLYVLFYYWDINLHLNLYDIGCRTPCEPVYVTGESGFVSCYGLLKSRQRVQISKK